MLKRKAEVFAPTDGMVSLSHDVPARGQDFADPTLYPTFLTLTYRRVRVSSRDVELAESTGCEITAKVETRAAPLLSADSDAIVRGSVFEVTRVESRGRTCWLWLSEVATDGTCDLLHETYEEDAVGIPQPRESTPTRVYVRRVAQSAKRSSSAGVDALTPSLTLRVRTVDYDGERRLRRGGRTYAIIATEPHGRWVDLTCKERGADRG